MAELVLELAQTVSGVGVKTSYGEPVDIDGTTVDPRRTRLLRVRRWRRHRPTPTRHREQRHRIAGAAWQGSGGGGGGSPFRSAHTSASRARCGSSRTSSGCILVATPFVWVTGKALKADHPRAQALTRALKH